MPLIEVSSEPPSLSSRAALLRIFFLFVLVLDTQARFEQFPEHMLQGQVTLLTLHIENIGHVRPSLCSLLSL